MTIPFTSLTRTPSTCTFTIGVGAAAGSDITHCLLFDGPFSCSERKSSCFKLLWEPYDLLSKKIIHPCRIDSQTCIDVLDSTSRVRTSPFPSTSTISVVSLPESRTSNGFYHPQSDFQTDHSKPHFFQLILGPL